MPLPQRAKTAENLTGKSPGWLSSGLGLPTCHRVSQSRKGEGGFGHSGDSAQIL